MYLLTTYVNQHVLAFQVPKYITGTYLIDMAKQLYYSKLQQAGRQLDKILIDLKNSLIQLLGFLQCLMK